MKHSSRFLGVAFLIVLCTMASSCTSTEIISSDPTASEELARESTSNAALIIFSNGTTANGYRVDVRPDSTEWYYINGGVRNVSATSNIVSISMRTPKVLSGILVGLFVGLLPSVGTGAMAGLSATNFFGPTDPNTQRAAFYEGFGMGMATSAILGGVIGSEQVTKYRP